MESLEAQIDRLYSRLARKRMQQPGNWVQRLVQATRDALRRRRRRRLAARSSRALAGVAVRAEDQSSAALLAVLTERVARCTTVDAGPDDLSDAIALTKLVIEKYELSAAKLMAFKDHATSNVQVWTKHVSTARAAGREDLAEEARGRVRDWTQTEASAAEELAEYEAGRRRLEDALVQLSALASRVRGEAS
jgi:hypothetical protein